MFDINQYETLPQVLVARAAEAPDELSQRYKDRGIWKRLTWKDVFDNVRRLALGLSALGFQRGETLAIVGENTPENFWAEYAAMCLGGKVVSLYPDVTPEEMTYLLDDSDSVIVVAEDQEQVDKILEIKENIPKVRQVIYWDDKGMWSYNYDFLYQFKSIQEMGDELAGNSPTLFSDEIAKGRLDDIAVLTYTSGTTGKPKGVITTHRYYFDNFIRASKAVDISPGTEYLSYVPTAWATEQMLGVGMGLLLPMVINFPEKPEEVLNNIRELAVEYMSFGPRQWESLAASVQAKMLDAGPLRKKIYEWGVKIGWDVNVSRMDGKTPPLLSKLLYPLADKLVLHHLRDNLGLTRAKVAISGGASMAPDVFRFFHAMGVPLRNMYGASEFGLFTAHQGDVFNLETVGHWMQADPRYGQPIEWRIGPGSELQVKGGSGFSGYYKREEKSAEKFVDDGWFCTGDAVNMTDSGELVFLERVDDMRELSTGHNYPPQFIETRLRFSPFIKDVMMVGDKTHPYVSALINIDPEVVGRWAEERKVAYSTFPDLSQKAEIRELIREEIQKVNEFLAPESRVKRFANFPKELDPDEGELTRTRKLRREFLEDRYNMIIEAIYSDASAVDCDIAIAYQDGRKGNFSAHVEITDIEGSEISAAA